ncbi:hypothetical protein EYF80_001917 [Liparis tanakae]|uniref:Uncharacterized protein n=1 Tax=Liparis tanakae TaxID=230148 RepID=A0A4Z2JDX2_9TELE|nr:hypothetical protein EYF80_001917 [Liparis tanakae]
MQNHHLEPCGRRVPLDSIEDPWHAVDHGQAAMEDATEPRNERRHRAWPAVGREAARSAAASPRPAAAALDAAVLLFTPTCVLLLLPSIENAEVREVCEYLPGSNPPIPVGMKDED